MAGELPGSPPPALPGIVSPEDGVCPGTPKVCVWPAPASHATCLDGWEGLSAALNYPGIGFLIFPSDKE